MKPVLEANEFAPTPNLMVMEVILKVLEVKLVRV